jgi:hypothetical protein
VVSRDLLNDVIAQRQMLKEELRQVRSEMDALRAKGLILTPEDRAELDLSRREKEEARKNYQEALKLERERVEREIAAAKAQEMKLRELLERELIEKELRTVAKLAGARYPDEVAQLLRPRYRVEITDGQIKPVVLTEDGKPMVDAQGRSVSLTDFVDAYLSERPHHRESTYRPGSGAGGGEHKMPAAGIEAEIEAAERAYEEAMKDKEFPAAKAIALKQQIAALKRKRDGKSPLPGF